MTFHREAGRFTINGKPITDNHDAGAFPRRIKIHMSRLLCLGLVLLLTACDSGEPVATPSAPPPFDEPETEKADAPGYVHFPLRRTPDYLRLPLDGPVSTLDPGMVQFTDAIELSEQLFLGLTDFDPQTYTVRPELAERWERNEAGTVYTFYLRQDAHWTNADPVTAHDLVWAIRRNLAPHLQAPYAHTLFILKNAEAFNKGELDDAAQVGVKALDDHTVEFTLENAASYFPALASLWIYRPLPRATIEQYAADWTQPRNIQSSGSYRVKRWEKGNVLVLEKNPYYYGVRDMDIEEVHYFIVPESSLGLSMYENDDLDLLGEGYLRLPLQELPRIRSDPELRRDLRVVPSFCTEIYVFNTRLPPVDDVLVRKALVAAINKRALIDFVIKGDQEPAGTFTRPPIFGSVPVEENLGIPFNPGQAKAWLAQAGYGKERKLPPLTVVINESETHQQIAKGLGVILEFYLEVELNIRMLDFDAYADVLFDPESQGAHMFRLGWCADYPDANNWLLEGFHPQKSPNFPHWDHARFAELTERAQYEEDPEVRRGLYRAAEVILNEEEAAIMPLYFATATFLVKPWIKDWHPMAFGGQHVRDWKLD